MPVIRKLRAGSSRFGSSDGTRRYLISLDDGELAETVFIPETYRNTICISSQVGCALDCKFCSTGRQGFNRDLKTAEILGQLFVANQSVRPTFRHLATARIPCAKK